MFSDSISFNARLLGESGSPWRTQIVDNLRVTDEAAQCFGRFASDLALAEGADSEKGNIAGLRGTAREEAYEALDIPFRKWLAGIGGGENPDAVMIEWRQTVKRILRRLANERLEAVSSAAFAGRKGHTAFEAELRFGAGLNTILKLSENRKEGQ
jgi:CRISPR system Cascade subunit CasA